MDRHFIRLAALLAVLALMSALTAPAAGASADAVIRDCSEDGVLNGHYTQSEIKSALKQLPSDIDEYTDCRSVIRAAQLGNAGGGHTANRPKGIASRVDTTAPPSAREQKRLGEATGSQAPLTVGGSIVRPGASAKPFNTSGIGGELPPLFVALLIATGFAAICAALFALRRSPRTSAPLARMGAGVRRGISRFRR
jgi:hypothetical protein